MAAASVRQRRYQAARNAWQETKQDLLTTTLGVPVVAEVPPGLNGALWQEDQESAARLARFTRLRKPHEGFAAPGLLNYTLLGQDQFFGAAGQAPTFGVTERRRDPWRERLLQDWRYTTTPILIGQDTMYGDPGQVEMFGVGQPYFPRPPLHEQGWQFAEPLSLLGADQFYGAAGQAITWGQSQPYFPRPPLHEEGWQYSPVPELIGQDQFYGDPGESAPTVFQPHFARPPLHAQGWQWVEPLALLGTDQFYGDPGQTPIFAVSQSVLVRRPFTQDFVASNLLSTLLEVAPETIPPGLNGVLQTFDFDPAVRAALGKALRYRQHQADPWAMLLLTGQDVFYGGPGQSITFGLSQPFPRKLWVPTTLDPLNNQGTVLAAVVEELPTGVSGYLTNPRRLPPFIMWDYVNNQGTVLAVVVAGPPAGSLLLLGVGI